MYSVAGDESHDAKNERVFAVAGLFGSEVQWDLAKTEWVKTTGGKIFHAADCESDQGNFANTDHKENLELYRDLAQLIARSGLWGFGAAIDLGAHQEFFPDVPKESPYHKCFFQVVFYFAELTAKTVPREKVKFTFDNRCETDYSAGQLYDWMVNDPDWELKDLLFEEISFASRKLPEIQMADLLARDGMKELDRLITFPDRSMRKSMRALLDTRRFYFDYHMREYFKDFKEKFPMVLEKSDLRMDEYYSWVEKSGLTDCWATRIKYANHVRAMQLREKMAKETA